MASFSDYALAGPLANSGYIQNFLHPDNAYNKAGDAENAGWNEAKKYQEPYWQHGNDQYGRLNDAENNLLNPEALYSKWASGYENSPYAKQMLAQNQASGMDAASQMGLSGSSAALGNIQQGAGNIVQQDRQAYLNDIMDKYMKGIGLGQDIYKTGATAGTNLGSQAMTHGQDQASLRYGANASQGKLFENLLRTGGKLAMGGGADSFNA